MRWHVGAMTAVEAMAAGSFTVAIEVTDMRTRRAGQEGGNDTYTQTRTHTHTHIHTHKMVFI